MTTALAIGFALGRMGREERLPLAKGAFVLAAGVSFGYAAAVRNQEPNGEVKGAFADLIRTVEDFLVDTQQDLESTIAEERAAKEVDDEDEEAAVDGDAEEIELEIEDHKEESKEGESS